ncbi:MAG: alpha/beta hydrolase [Hyphomonadaceae bacterium]
MPNAMAKFVFSLPSSILTAMAGGRVEVDGKVLDPRIALMAKQAAARPSMTAFPPTMAREGMKAAFAMIDAPRRANVAVRDLKVPGAAGDLDARLYTPPGATGDEPLLVYMHQGGCVIGGVWTCDTWCSILSEDVRAVVLNVDYRHAPEHKFPAAVDDAVAAFDWAVANAKDLGADGKRVGVGGDSAGGYLSAVVCQARKRAGLSQPWLQLLIYPATDWTSKDGSMVTMGDAYPLNAEVMAWFTAQYLNDPEAEASDWRCSPALAPDKTGLARALIFTAGFDPLTTQAEAYSRMLKDAGVETLYRNYPSLSHSFTAMSGAVPAARDALEEIAQDVKRAFG